MQKMFRLEAVVIKAYEVLLEQQKDYVSWS